ncbi:hypothetical protein [Nocardia sp. NPDC051833]|uniref:alpha/beta fold hydrolase n=1 Tax=Nocardia sp. NPDC051833 TaxID=3155674 RepID=UPI00343EA175
MHRLGYERYGAQGGDFGSGVSQALQAATPQTIGYTLADSPVGQLAWIAERFAQWTDPRSPIDDDRMLTDISLYWLTATAASSARLHRETTRGVTPCPVPLGVAVFPRDITQSVRPPAERLYDIRHWSEFDRGGHFAAMEVPELPAEDIRTFFLGMLDDQLVDQGRSVGISP